MRKMFATVDKKDIGYQWRRAAPRFVLLPEICGKPPFSAATVWLSAACADET